MEVVQWNYPVNAGKIPVTALPGSAYFDSADSFAMIRGGHIDVAIMGGLEVDEKRNLANWAVPGKPLLGVWWCHGPCLRCEKTNHHLDSYRPRRNIENSS
jgi:3-oxoacid CoA-transferase B subunit